MLRKIILQTSSHRSPFSTLSIDLLLRSGVTRDLRSVDRQTELSVIGTLSRMFSTPSVAGPTFQSCVGNIGLKDRMSSCNLISRGLDGFCKRGRRLEPGYAYKSLPYCGRASLKYSVCYGERRSRGFYAARAVPYSSGAASSVSFEGVPMEEQFADSVVVSDQKSPGARTLYLSSGSCYLPHPDKERTGGEDAHFICIDEQAIGVADGVGGWADLGIDSGEYARKLMSNSVTAIKEEPNGSIDPARVLEKAFSWTKEKGSSTACIITLTDQGVHAVNLGDSGFIVIREGSIIFRSPVQQHDFNMPFQLDSGGLGDLPCAAQVFTFPVASGDVIIAGTDGLFDNLYTNEVAAVVVNAIRAKVGPQVTAEKIAALARQRALDTNRQTPFSTAAQHAGYRYHGGKLDDVSVVVSYITATSSS